LLLFIYFFTDGLDPPPLLPPIPPPATAGFTAGFGFAAGAVPYPGSFCAVADLVEMPKPLVYA
jgi:hypothetical protein